MWVNKKLKKTYAGGLTIPSFAKGHSLTEKEGERGEKDSTTPTTRSRLNRAKREGWYIKERERERRMVSVQEVKKVKKKTVGEKKEKGRTTFKVGPWFHCKKENVKGMK